MCVLPRLGLVGILVVLLLTAAVTAQSSPLQAQARRTVADGVYTTAQADRGATTYSSECSRCHGENLDGQSGPPLRGEGFLNDWSGQPLAALGTKIGRTMPGDKPGTLTPAQVADVVAYLLRSSRLAAGTTPLSADDAALKQIEWPKTNASAAPNLVASHAPTLPPAGNMAQVMRGILFPSSNIVFNSQSQDPAEQKVGWQPDKTAFTWVDWGAGIYSGWEMIDFAAIAIADSAPLLLVPRRCENGKAAPVDQPDWIKFTAELADAGRASYKASQARDRDAVIESTNQLAEACLNCHSRYRDKPGRTSGDPSNKAGRCIP